MIKPQSIQLLHNPGAGAHMFTAEKLLQMLQQAGWNCRYSSTEGDWEIDSSTDMVIIAGGDGTVRKVAEKIISRPRKPVLAILPLGTANNISRSLQINGDIKDIINGWSNGNTVVKSIDTGTVNSGIANGFFLEAIGWGLFPQMILDMKHRKTPAENTPEENLRSSLQALHKTVESYDPEYCYMEVDGNVYSGRFLLLEIMNIRSIGPNLFLAPGADLADRQLEIVMARAHEKEKVLDYLWHKLQFNEDICLLQTIKGKHIKLQWYGGHLHADDKLLSIPVSAELEIGVREGTLQFITGGV
jgi:diacylglycerol kinase family enzyme